MTQPQLSRRHLLAAASLLIPGAARSQPAALAAIPEGPFFVRIGGPVYTGLRINRQEPSVGLLIGEAILRTEIEALPEQRLKYTDYNRHTVKWFKYGGIDVAARQVLLKFRYRYQKLEDKPIIGGRMTVFDNAADVTAGLRMTVADRQVAGQLEVHRIDADWAGGLLGMLQSLLDGMVGGVSFITTGKFTRLIDYMTMVAPMLVNLALSEQLKLRAPFENFNRWNQEGYVYLDRIEYANNGLWLIAKLDVAKLGAFAPILLQAVQGMMR
jgi:hypothetical protein